MPRRNVWGDCHRKFLRVGRKDEDPQEKSAHRTVAPGERPNRQKSHILRGRSLPYLVAISGDLRRSMPEIANTTNVGKSSGAARLAKKGILQSERWQQRGEKSQGTESVSRKGG